MDPLGKWFDGRVKAIKESADDELVKAAQIGKALIDYAVEQFNGIEIKLTIDTQKVTKADRVVAPGQEQAPNRT